MNPRETLIKRIQSGTTTADDADMVVQLMSELTQLRSSHMWLQLKLDEAQTKFWVIWVIAISSLIGIIILLWP